MNIRNGTESRDTSKFVQETYQTMIATKIMTNMILMMMITKFRISRSSGVKPIFGALVIFAILPNTVPVLGLAVELPFARGPDIARRSS